MYDLLKIGVVSHRSIEGLEILSWDIPPLQPITRQYTQLPGSLKSAAGERTLSPGLITVDAALLGDSDAVVTERLRAAEAFFLSGTRWVFSDRPQDFYEGECVEMTVKEKNEAWTRFTARVRVNPPCRQRALNASFTLPSGDFSAEGVTQALSTVYKSFTSAGTLDGYTAASPLPARMLLRVTGSFTTLTLGGGLTFPEAQSSGTLYLDTDAQRAWKKSGSTRTNVSFSGDFDALRQNPLSVSGSGLDCTVYALAVERG